MTLWLNHIGKLFGEDAEHIIHWFAHRVQHPEIKINHALVLGGAQGIGKDTILEPVKRAVGEWNFTEVSPTADARTLQRLHKVRDFESVRGPRSGDFDRFGFYDHSKSFIAAPPDVLRVDEKHVREYMVPNLTGVIITTNHKTNGIYLPADDRRHFVAWSDMTKEDFTPAYWNKFWRWYEEGGHQAVAHYLSALNLSAWSPKAPPPATAAFFEIVTSSRAPEDAEMDDALEALNRPDVTTLQLVKDMAAPDFDVWLGDRKNSRRIPHRLEACGYVAVPNEGQKDGRWKIKGKNVTVYARTDLSFKERIMAARRFVELDPVREVREVRDPPLSDRCHPLARFAKVAADKLRVKGEWSVR